MWQRSALQAAFHVEHYPAVVRSSLAVILLRAETQYVVRVARVTLVHMLRVSLAVLIVHRASLLGAEVVAAGASGGAYHMRSGPGPRAMHPAINEEVSLDDVRILELRSSLVGVVCIADRRRTWRSEVSTVEVGIVISTGATRVDAWKSLG